MQSGDEGPQRGDGHIGNQVEGAFRDDRAVVPVEIQHRRETEIKPTGQHLTGEQPAGFPTQPGAKFWFPLADFAQPLHGGQFRIAVLQALDAAALLIYRQQQSGPDLTHRGDQLLKCSPRADVAIKKNDAADQRVAQQVTLLGGHRLSGQVQHHGAGICGHGHLVSGWSGASPGCRRVPMHRDQGASWIFRQFYYLDNRQGRKNWNKSLSS